jgi:hypothetical protein
MTVFVIIGQPGTNAARLPGAIAQEFPDNFLKIQDTTWLIASKGTAQEISDKLGISEGTNGSAVVASINTYFGRATPDPDIWEWVKTKWESTGG